MRKDDTPAGRLSDRGGRRLCNLLPPCREQDLVLNLNSGQTHQYRRFKEIVLVGTSGETKAFLIIEERALNHRKMRLYPVNPQRAELNY